MPDDNDSVNSVKGLEIDIKVRGLPFKKVDEFEHFQGNLKRLSRAQLAKLKASIIRNGFNAPIFVWAGHDYILDGHQRLLAVKSLINDGMTLKNNELPYCEIEAATEQQAKEMVLTYNSQYGDVSPEALAELLEGIGLEAESLQKFIALPDIDVHEVMWHMHAGPEYEIVTRDMEETEREYLISQGGNAIWRVSKAYVRIGRYYFFIDHDMAEQIGRMIASKGKGNRGPKWFIQQFFPDLPAKKVRNIGPLWVLPPTGSESEGAKRADEMTEKEIDETEPQYVKRAKKDAAKREQDEEEK